jgi:hypothetical protein
MTGGAVLKAAWAGAARRLVQSAVVFVVVTATAAGGVLGLALATSSNEAFQTAFTLRRGADLAVTVDAAKVTGAELASTRHVPGVTRAAGPYPETTINLSLPGQGSGSVTVVGRASRSGPLDDITQNSGRWATREGEIDLAIYSSVRGSIGQVVTATVTSVRGKPRLTVAGYASSVVAHEEDGWVLPSELAALEEAGAPTEEQMLYTFRQASTPAQINADLARLKAALPAGAITGYVSWLDTEHSLAAAQGTTTPFVVAYAVIGLLLAAVITAIVAAAAVVASYHRIGVLKSIGFAPAQVVAAYLAQLGIPAVAGCVAGTALGNRWALPLIDTGPFRISVGVPLWINLSVPAGICALVALAALVPAVRAGRLPAVQAIAAGLPRTARGHAPARLAGRLRLPRPVTIGLASPFSHPAPSLATIAVITFGLTAVVLAVGLDSQMAQIVPIAGWATIGASLVRRLTPLMAILAGLGVFSWVLMLARERVHDLGVFKALGMTLWQIITMVLCWVLAPTTAAAAIALPAGVALEGAVARAIQGGGPGTVVPPGGAHPPRLPLQGAHLGPAAVKEHGRQLATVVPPGGAHQPGRPLQHGHLVLAHVYTPGGLTLLALAGLAIALTGALGPAIWAGASKTTTALRAE